MESFNIKDWEALVNKPVYTNDGKDVGVIQVIQPERIIVSYGPITPDRYAIPKASIVNFNRGIVFLKENEDFVKQNYKFE